MKIPENEGTIGYVGDNKVETRCFEINDSALLGFDFKLDLKSGTYKGIVDLEKSINEGRIILSWIICEEHLPQKGLIYIQLRAFSNNDEKWHSDHAYLYVNESINATAYFDSPLPSEFEQMEQRVTSAKNETLATAQAVAEDKAEIAINTQTVAAHTSTVIQKAAEVESNAQGVEANTESAVNSASIASQALSDLLSMLGTDIATLIDGKLSPSQIPALSINEIFQVANIEDILALTAQRGDVALLVNDDTVRDSYMLAADDASVMTNWKKLGVSHVANAQYAMIADEAVNATTINGHRLVTMTESQYANAVLEDNTLYAVYPD